MGSDILVQLATQLPHIFIHFRTYMTAYEKIYGEASTFCQSQHSAGRVIWDTQEKYLDLKYIVGREGRDRSAFTALYNDGASAVCNSALSCDGRLVKLNYVSNIFI